MLIFTSSWGSPVQSLSIREAIPAADIWLQRGSPVHSIAYIQRIGSLRTTLTMTAGLCREILCQS